jgi:hypothetical protein
LNKALKEIDETFTDEEKNLVFVHFDFDNYRPDKMDDLKLLSEELLGKFKVYRMVPQG